MEGFTSQTYQVMWRFAIHSGMFLRRFPPVEQNFRMPEVGLGSKFELLPKLELSVAPSTKPNMEAMV
jgi:hypothetical protein